MTAEEIYKKVEEVFQIIVKQKRIKQKIDIDEKREIITIVVGSIWEKMHVEKTIPTDVEEVKNYIFVSVKNKINQRFVKTRIREVTDEIENIPHIDNITQKVQNNFNLKENKDEFRKNYFQRLTMFFRFIYASYPIEEAEGMVKYNNKRFFDELNVKKIRNKSNAVFHIPGDHSRTNCLQIRWKRFRDNGYKPFFRMLKAKTFMEKFNSDEAKKFAEKHIIIENF